ncbi:MAG: MaoC family dehydratase [Candidatus Dormibacteraeota bacterium]|nr:MaoC family dehydratase [Candidatus Dormibacteraeota bacterium]
MAALERRFVARNEPGLPNAVHHDEFARRLGFRAGLVPGADLYGFMAELSAQALGRRWQEAGALSARFNSPVYDGEEVAVCASRRPDGLVLELVNPDGLVCATGAAVAVAEGGQPDREQYPVMELPSRQGPPAFVQGQALGTLQVQLPSQDLAWAPRLGNQILMANADLPPWMHVESRVRHLGLPGDAEAVSVRGTVAGTWERLGHRFVDLDLLILGSDDRPLAQLRHVAIVELAQLRRGP